jgi:hypothetical protein
MILARAQTVAIDAGRTVSAYTPATAEANMQLAFNHRHDTKEHA